MSSDESVQVESGRDDFLGDPQFECESLYDSDRIPNVVITTDGTVLATWGGYQWPQDEPKTYPLPPEGERGLRVRRSTDGGHTWGEPIVIGNGEHGGGVTVDETTGDVLAFVDFRDDDMEPGMYRSRDDGQSWEAAKTTIEADENGNVPQLHTTEHGITLRQGPHAGRLLRAAKVNTDDHRYNTALYSDDHGETWIPSAPFPVSGTGEGAVAELSDGRIYYSSRRARFDDDDPRRSDRLYAWSEDGGETWQDPAYDETLPDGPRYRGDNGRASCFPGHFGMFGGLVRLPIADEDVLVYSNVDNAGYQRRSVTVWGSFDGGDTWPVKRRVYSRPSAYASLAAGRPGTASEGWIYLLFERGKITGDRRTGGDYPDIEYTGGSIARFTLRWLVRGELTGDGDLPRWARR